MPQPLVAEGGLLAVGRVPAEEGKLALAGRLLEVELEGGGVLLRRKDVRASYISFWPYLLVALAFLLVLGSVDTLAAWIFLPYFLYLGYAIWWGRRLWQLNASMPRAT